MNAKSIDTPRSAAMSSSSTTGAESGQHDRSPEAVSQKGWSSEEWQLAIGLAGLLLLGAFACIATAP